MKERSLKPEIMDLGPGHYSRNEFWDCHNKLGKIGRLLGGDRATVLAFREIGFSSGKVLDVGCGGGHLTAKLARIYPQAEVLGIDTSEEAIRYANSRHPSLPNLRFEHRIQPELNDPPESFDIVTSTLVCHHMSDSEIVGFLAAAAAMARQGVVINDLHRHPMAWASFAAVSPILFRNRLIQHDGLLSIKRAFCRSDWERYLEEAGIPKHKRRIRWRWAFRWLVTIS